MLHSFLAFAATGELRISVFKLGPTEFRLAVIVINTLLIFYGTRKMIRALPFVAAGALVVLCVGAYRTQRAIWDLDLAAKDAADANKFTPRRAATRR